MVVDLNRFAPATAGVKHYRDFAYRSNIDCYLHHTGERQVGLGNAFKPAKRAAAEINRLKAGIFRQSRHDRIERDGARPVVLQRPGNAGRDQQLARLKSTALTASWVSYHLRMPCVLIADFHSDGGDQLFELGNIVLHVICECFRTGPDDRLNSVHGELPAYVLAPQRLL